MNDQLLIIKIAKKLKIMEKIQKNFFFLKSKKKDFSAISVFFFLNFRFFKNFKISKLHRNSLNTHHPFIKLLMTKIGAILTIIGFIETPRRNDSLISLISNRFRLLIQTIATSQRTSNLHEFLLDSIR